MRHELMITGTASRLAVLAALASNPARAEEMAALVLLLLGTTLPPGLTESACPTGLSPGCVQDRQRRLEQLAADDVAACCSACTEREGCSAFTFYELHGKPTCNLFGGDAPALQPGNCTSGVLASPPPAPPLPPAPAGAKNLLYFIVDDLRTALGQRHPNMAITPHLDRLASESATFTHAYCNHAVCAPSRDSFMSGLRPGKLQLWTFKGDFRHAAAAGPSWVSHPQHYKEHNYLTLGGGKTYHPGRPKNWDEPYSWSQDLPYFPFVEEGCPVVDASGLAGKPANGYTRSLCVLDIADDDTFDHRLANNTIAGLRLAKTQNRPFALFAGHRRPHVPWRLPRKWWDLYEGKDIAPPTQPDVYSDAPEIAFTCGDQCQWRLWTEGQPPTRAGQAAAPMANYTRGTPLEPAFSSLIRRAYYAAVSLMDDSVGRTLAVLEELGLEQDTVIIFHAGTVDSSDTCPSGTAI